MKVAFHINQFTVRGTEVVNYDYAHDNETLLGRRPTWLATPIELG
jgi:hypothetical protein